MMMQNTFTISGIGKVLFDELSEGKQLGGTSVNFTFHAQNLGLKAYPISDVEQDASGALQDQYELDYIGLTCGDKCALLKSRLVCCDCPCFKIKVVDTVGAGDSYSAVLTFGILHKLPLDKINQLAIM